MVLITYFSKSVIITYLIIQTGLVVVELIKIPYSKQKKKTQNHRDRWISWDPQRKTDKHRNKEIGTKEKKRKKLFGF